MIARLHSSLEDQVIVADRYKCFWRVAAEVNLEYKVNEYGLRRYLL